MSGNDWLVWRLTFALILGATVAWALYRRSGPSDFISSKTDKPRYGPLFSYWLLPLYILLLLSFSFRALKLGGFNSMLGLLSQVFLQLALYDGLMLLLLPLLRRYLQPQTCVFLWMLPNYLYLAQQGLYQPPRPLAVIPLPLTTQAIYAVCWVWLAGFAGVLGWKVCSHLRFRRRILRPAQTIADPQTVLLWRELTQWMGYADRYHPPVRSPAVSTPLSIGLFRSTIRVVLPERDYTQDELALILRHELIHIGRADSTAKFFLTFCSALCWFNPLVWSAMARGAEELELSCDQEVLEHIGSAGGEGYARLLLCTAGEQAGFTTCLSASASALRYRLRHVLHPVCRGVHGGVAGLAAAAMLLASGWVTFSYHAGTGRDLLLLSTAPHAYEVLDAYRFLNGTGPACRLTDQDALLDYLSGLELRAVAGSYDYLPNGEELYLTLQDSEDAMFRLVVQNDTIRMSLINRPSITQVYQAAGGVDWNYLDSLLVQA